MRKIFDVIISIVLEKLAKFFRGLLFGMPGIQIRTHTHINEQSSSIYCVYSRVSADNKYWLLSIKCFVQLHE